MGNTQTHFATALAREAHPHGCGEHVGKGTRRTFPPGSSPRVWGTLIGSLDLGKATGLIPTGVGNTPESKNPKNHSGAHPHGCGEHKPRELLVRAWAGSSPRVWGTRRQACGLRITCRLIPTGVGNTGHQFYVKHWSWAHPHGCGEHAMNIKTGMQAEGSSPRVWGTRHFFRRLAGCRGLIPTGVGNTRPGSLLARVPGAHPHGCGEHRLRNLYNQADRGSSPRVWGTRSARCWSIFSSGLIPTGVGNTVFRPSEARHLRAHPHGCGEHATDAPRFRAVRGSSPRVWGTLPYRPTTRPYRGLIPTGVGNTESPG